MQAFTSNGTESLTTLKKIDLVFFYKLLTGLSTTEAFVEQLNYRVQKKVYVTVWGLDNVS